jgi:hemerythrin
MINWSPDFETGVAMVDADHRQLVSGLNQLEQAIELGQGSKAIDRIVAGLEQYAAAHFAREEDCMHRLHCPVAAANESAHRQFLASVKRAKTKLAQPGAAALVAIGIHGELVAWIRQHILTIDRHLRSCVGAPR